MDELLELKPCQKREWKEAEYAVYCYSPNKYAFAIDTAVHVSFAIAVSMWYKNSGLLSGLRAKATNMAFGTAARSVVIEVC